MSNKTQPRFRNALATLILGVGIGIGGTLVGLKAAGVPLTPGTDTAAFHKFFNAYSDLHNRYFTSESDSTLLNGAIDGMTKSLGDPFTDYFPPADAKQFQNMLSGSYVGIGVTIEQVNEQVVIQSVMKDAPAEKAGLKAQDIITKVAGKPITGMSVDDVSHLIIGPEGSKVMLTIQRGSTSLEIPVTRQSIKKQSVFSKVLDNHIGYLQITVVSENTGDEVKTELDKLKGAGVTSLIVDVRGNPGGYLDQAVQIAGQFVPKGKVVVQTVERDGSVSKMPSPGPGTNLPVVVLMDQDTASAAEIISAALHEDIGATLVGTKSYGKGTMQQTEPFSDGSSLKFTVGKWLTPNGEWIHKKGLQPDVAEALPAYVTLPPVTGLKLPLKSGDNKTDVQDVQKTLQALGYHLDRTDGYYDASTVQAVTQFQRDNKLTATGEFDTSTANAVADVFSRLISKSDTQLDEAEKIAAQKAK